MIQRIHRLAIRAAQRLTTKNAHGLALGRVATHAVLSHKGRPRSKDGGLNASGRVLYVAASTLPYHISGYATRTQAILAALLACGKDVACVTRPGYPADRPDVLAAPQGRKTQVDGVTYWHTDAPTRYRPTLFYAMQGARVIAHEAKRLGASRIHAASNHVNALPALLAARQLGIPFSYEMRGLWELTRISRQPAFENSHAYKQGLALEALVAQQADRVFVISEQLRRYMQEQAGVDGGKMHLLPNCVDKVVAASPRRRKPGEPWVIGYAGSIINYEGLDLLVEAVALLVRRHVPVQVCIVGDGEARTALQEQVEQLALREHIQFFGKVAPARAQAIMADCDVVCLPRRPFKVCRVVPPIKLVEALAMGKPVVLPDLPVFRDETGSAAFARFFEPGNAVDLAGALETLLDPAENLTCLADQARAHVEANRRWEEYVREL